MTENKLQPFMYLWKINDAEWMKQRENDWKVLKNNWWYSRYSRKDKKITKEYFCTGRYLEYIPCSNLYLLAPIETKEQNKSFFFSDVIDDNNRSSLLFDFREYIRSLHGVDWAKKRSKMHITSIIKCEDGFTELLNNKYEIIKKKIDEPSGFCNLFLSHLKSHSKTTSLDKCIDHGVLYDWLDYLLTILRHANDPEFLCKNVVDELFEAVDQVIDAPEIVTTRSFYKWNSKLVKKNVKVKSFEDITRIYAEDLPDILPSAIELAHYLKEKEEEIRKNWYYNRIKQ